MRQNRWSTVVRATLKYDDLKMSHSGCALVRHFQPWVHGPSYFNVHSPPCIICILTDGESFYDAFKCLFYFFSLTVFTSVLSSETVHSHAGDRRLQFALIAGTLGFIHVNSWFSKYASAQQYRVWQKKYPLKDFWQYFHNDWKFTIKFYTPSVCSCLRNIIIFR